MGQLSVLDQKGDIRISWDRNKPAEVEAVRKQFNDFKEKGFLSFEVSKDGRKGRMIREFDPCAEEILITPPVVGG